MRRGFTLSELLVTIAIVVVSLGLMIPALNQAQQDARKAACKNNMKLLGLAFHNYHDTYNLFPPGWTSREAGPGAGPRFGWQLRLTPYLDQAPLYNQLNFNKPADDPANARLLKTEIKSLRCLADPTPAVNSLRGGYATSNYSGNYGSAPFPRWAHLGLGDFWPGAVEAPMGKTDGIFWRNGAARLRDMTDGPSNIILVGERGFASGAAIWAGVTDNSHEDDTLTDLSHLSRLNAGPTSFSSRHPGGVHILLGDGAVRFISDFINSQPPPNMGVWQKLASRHDGAAIGDF